LNAWHAAPTDSGDLLALNEPGRYLWIAGEMQGDGSSTPALHNLLIEYDHESWLRYLPTIYRGGDLSANGADTAGKDAVFLERALSLFESLLSDSERLINELPRLFDPGAAPDEPAGESWLDWLASWLDFELDETWNEPHRREALARASALYAQRGTADSLRELLQLYTGADVRIEEPSGYVSMWSLGEHSTLGLNTMLAPAYAEGAVLDTTATLDQSHLIDEMDYGAPLFEGSAHHFCVQLHAASVPDPQAIERVRQIIEREKPAHTSYHLCLLEPRMRVGFQARIGVDTIVGGGDHGPVIGGDAPLGHETVLPEESRPPAMGRDARVGRRGRMT
jgi:phage tail-like protein